MPLSQRAVHHALVLGCLLASPLWVGACGSTDRGDSNAENGGTAGEGGAGPSEAGAANHGGETSSSLTFTSSEGMEIGLYLPTPPPKGKPPVIMFLHGYTNNPIATPPFIIDAANQIEPTAVIMPVRPSSEGASAWGGTYDSELRPSMQDALAELDRVIDERGLDESRQYLYGESMGAEGVFMLLYEFPTRFAGAVAVAGYSLDLGAEQMKETPLWIIHGAEDTVNPTSSSREIYQSILDAGGTRVTYTEYEGLGHSDAIVKARGEPEICEWLLEQRP